MLSLRRVLVQPMLARLANRLDLDSHCPWLLPRDMPGLNWLKGLVER